MRVSEEAKAVLASLLEGREEKQVLRLSVADGHHTLALDEVRAGDLTFHHRGRPVLVIGDGVSRDLWGLSIDSEEGETGLRIVLRRTATTERGDTGTSALSMPAVDHRSDEHTRLLEEVNEITALIAALRLSHSADKIPRIRELEAAKQAKWHEIRTLWAAATRLRLPETGPSWQAPT